MSNNLSNAEKKFVMESYDDFIFKVNSIKENTLKNFKRDHPTINAEIIIGKPPKHRRKLPKHHGNKEDKTGDIPKYRIYGKPPIEITSENINEVADMIFGYNAQ